MSKLTMDIVKNSLPDEEPREKKVVNLLLFLRLMTVRRKKHVIKKTRALHGNDNNSQWVRSNSRSNVRCYHCKKLGHTQREYRV